MTFLLMNAFNSHDETQRTIQKYANPKRSSCVALLTSVADPDPDAHVKPVALPACGQGFAAPHPVQREEQRCVVHRRLSALAHFGPGPYLPGHGDLLKNLALL